MWNDNKNPKAAPIYKDVGICCLEIVPQLSLSIYTFIIIERLTHRKVKTIPHFHPTKLPYLTE